MSDNENDDEVAPVEPETTEEVTDVVAEEVVVEEVEVEVVEVVEVEENAPIEEVVDDDDQKQGLAQEIEVDPPKADETAVENVPKKKKKKRKRRKKHSKVEEEEEDDGSISSAKAWKTIAVKSGNPKYNWYACKIKGKIGKSTKLVVEQSGTGGAKECSAYLQQQDSQILFGLILAKSYDSSNSIRSKLTPCMGAIDDQFPTKHLTVELSEQCGDMLTPEALSTQLLRIGGAHKPDRYEFGPGQNIDV